LFGLIVDPIQKWLNPIQTKNGEIQAIQKQIFVLDFPDFRKNLKNPNIRTTKSKQ
jgi:hypothetical protein